MWYVVYGVQNNTFFFLGFLFYSLYRISYLADIGLNISLWLYHKHYRVDL